MTPSDKDHAAGKAAPPQRDKGAASRSNPELAQGLKQLYGSVVDEPLPAALQDLLARLDDSEDK